MWNHAETINASIPKNQRHPAAGPFRTGWWPWQQLFNLGKLTLQNAGRAAEPWRLQWWYYPLKHVRKYRVAPLPKEVPYLFDIYWMVIGIWNPHLLSILCSFFLQKLTMLLTTASESQCGDMWGMILGEVAWYTVGRCDAHFLIFVALFEYEFHAASQGSAGTAWWPNAMHMLRLTPCSTRHDFKLPLAKKA